MGKPLHLLLGAGVLVHVTSALGALAAPGPAITPQGVFDDLRKSWIGEWSCTKSVTGTKPVHWSEAVTPFGDKWIKTIGVYPAAGARPAVPFESVFGYDGDRHQWVTVTYLSNGTYGIDKGTNGPTPMSIIWVNAYPISTGDSVTQVLSQHGYTVDGNFMDKGKPISYHWNCAKR